MSNADIATQSLSRVFYAPEKTPWQDGFVEPKFTNQMIFDLFALMRMAKYNQIICDVVFDEFSHLGWNGFVDRSTNSTVAKASLTLQSQMPHPNNLSTDLGFIHNFGSQFIKSVRIRL